MAGVEQTTAAGAATPDDTPNPSEEASRRGSRRSGRRGRKSGQQSDAKQPDPQPTPDSEPSLAAPSPEKTSGRTSHRADDEPQDRASDGPEETADKAAHRAAKHSDDEPEAGIGSEPDGKPGSHAVPERASERAPEPAAVPTPEAAVRDTLPPPASTTPGTALEPVRTTPGTDLVPVRAAHGAKPAHGTAPIYRPRHAKQRRNRWLVLIAAGLVLVALAGAGAAVILTRQSDGTEDAVAPAATRVAPAPANFPPAASGASGVPSAAVPPPAAAPGTATCRFNAAPDKSPKIVPPGRATRSGLVNATIGTNRGQITMELDATNAPCTVESFLTLAGGGYFTDTACHRLTTMLIFVLQCGDPTATGAGDPGYSFDDENLPAPGGTPYPRGTLAMANAGPDTNGGQFFIVYKDSPIDPNYPVFGKVTGGLEIVDQVAAGGAPSNDGQPNSSLVIQSVRIA